MISATKVSHPKHFELRISCSEFRASRSELFLFRDLSARNIDLSVTNIAQNLPQVAVLLTLIFCGRSFPSKPLHFQSSWPKCRSLHGLKGNSGMTNSRALISSMRMVVLTRLSSRHHGLHVYPRPSGQASISTLTLIPWSPHLRIHWTITIHAQRTHPVLPEQAPLPKCSLNTLYRVHTYPQWYHQRMQRPFAFILQMFLQTLVVAQMLLEPLIIAWAALPPPV